MDTEIKRKNIYFSKMITRKKADILAETDVIVPDSKPDAMCIISVKSDVKITGREIQSDRVLIYGNICYRILYKDEKNCSNCIKTDSSFTDVIDLMGAVPGVNLSVDYRLKKTDYHILNGRKLSLKSCISLDLCAYTSEELNAVCDIVSTDMQKKFGEFTYMDPKTDYEKIFSVNDSAEIPTDRYSASEILDIDSHISDKSVRVINNKVIAKGEVITDIIYKESESGEIRKFIKNSPFTEIFDVDGISEDDFSYTDLSVVKTNYATDSDAIRDIELSTEIKSRVYCYKNDTVSLVDDCYSIENVCEIEKKGVKITSPVKNFEGQVSVKDKIESDKGILEILSISAENENQNVICENENILIKGNVLVKALILDNEKNIESIEKTVPFNFSASIGENTDTYLKDIYAEVSNPSYSLSDSGGAEVRFNASVKGIIYKQEEIMPIENVVLKEREKKETTASITVYFVQEGDSLWEISKKYLTDPDKIKKLNNMTDIEPVKGTKLFIPKYKK